MKHLKNSLVLFIVFFTFLHTFKTANASYSVCSHLFCYCTKSNNRTYADCIFGGHESPRGLESNVNQGNETIISLMTIRSNNNSLIGLIPNGFLRDHKLMKLSANNLGWSELDRNLFEDVLGIRFLDLRSNKLENADFSGLPLAVTSTLESIELSHNLLRSVPSFDPLRFPKIHRINLSFNKIDNLTHFDDDLHSLERLDLSHNLIRSIDFDKFPLLVRRTLKIIKLRSNRICQVSPLGSFQNLEYFSIAQNDLNELNPDMFVDLPILDTIDVSKNRLVRLPVDVFKHVESLRVLNLAHNSLSDLRARDFETLINLIQLELQHNKLKRVSLEWFANLANLEVLDLSHNHIETFQTDSSIQLDNLKDLRLTANRLKLLDEPKRYFPELIKLEIDRNNLTRMPSNLTNIIFLNMSRNGVLSFENLQITRSRSSRDNLLILDLSYNQLLVSDPKSFCIQDDSKSNLTTVNPQSLELTLSETALASMSRCTLKNLARFFRSVHVNVVLREKSKPRNELAICKCEFRLFLARFHILIETCGTLVKSKECKVPFDDCP